MRTRESEEMYLETILLLQNKKAEVHSVDIVAELNYAKSSVSRAVNLLRKRGYLAFGANGEILLTEEGRRRAAEIFERHNVITSALMKIGADPDTAETNACRIEHVVSDGMFEIIKNFVKQGE